MPSSKSLDLSGRVCLVVGGGGGGIGTAMVEALAAAGADVGAVTYVDEHASDTAERVTALGRRVSTVVADVTDDDALTAAVAKVTDELGPVQHLVNVVGGSLLEDWHRAIDYDMEAFDRVVARNLRYAVLACREVARGLDREGLPGSIVNISSLAAKGMPLLGAYSAAKAGLEAFSRTMALEWGPRGVRVNVVACGTIHTPRSGTNAAVEEAAARIPLGRRGEPSEIADAVLFLLSDLARYVTGQVLAVDGGSGTGEAGEALPTFVSNATLRERFG